MKEPAYFCYTDGSCRKSEGAPGGWGFFLRGPDGFVAEGFGGATDTSSLMMELIAIREGLRAVPENAVTVRVFSDSRAALDFCGTKAIRRDYEPVLQEIGELLELKKLEIQWTWLRGHNGNTGNQRADALADQGAREAKSRIAVELKQGVRKPAKVVTIRK